MKALKKLGLAAFELSQRDKKAYLLGPRRVRHVLARAVFWLLVLVGCGIWANWRIQNGGGWYLLDGVLGALLGVSGVRAGTATLKSAMSYRDGWLDGRNAFMHALAEAERRGMRPTDALNAQLEIDRRLLGM